MGIMTTIPVLPFSGQTSAQQHINESTWIGMKQDNRRWRRIRPRSVTGLLLASFTLVAVPLLAATMYSFFYVDRLSDQSERLVLRGINIARASKKLNTIVTDMERDARQYRILGKPVLAQRFANHKSHFDTTLQALGKLKLVSMPSWNLDTLAAQATSLATAIRAGPQAVAAVLPLFDVMHNEVGLITQQGDVFIDGELAKLQDTTADARHFLLLCLFMLVPGVIVLAAIFTIVIARPVRQITAVIDRLGRGEFKQPVHISAPSSELDQLGRQLDRMRQRLGTLEQERNQFLRHMSHELKTPLASIREGAELLHDGTTGELQPAQKEVTEIIRQNSVDLMLLIENLLDFSARNRLQSRLEYTRCDLQALAASVSQRQKLPIDRKNLTVVLPEQPVQLTADSDRIHLVIDNLLSNAVKFSPPHGTIHIQASRRKREVTLVVSDEGPGIAPEERDLIFEAFYRSSQSREDARIRGTGIGLSVVNDCVHAHDGSIDIEDNPGGGARFCITLPDHDYAPT